MLIYRDEIYSLQILLSRTQAGPGRTVKQEQEEISPNHVQRLNLISVHADFTLLLGFVKCVLNYLSAISDPHPQFHKDAQ